jgi:hypothetical protein
MSATRRKKNGTQKLALKGFFHLQIRDKKTGKIVGDSGWIENQITNYGLYNCFVGGPIKGAATVQISGAMLGSGTNPASSAVTLNGSNTKYYSALATAINNSTQAQLTASFDGAVGAATIANVGLFAASDPAAPGSLIAGKTYTQSTIATTQDVTLTYNLEWSRTVE